MEVTGWINLTILLSILATLLQVAGFVAPMWIWLDVDEFKVGVGLWFTVGCGLQGTCNTAAPTVSFGYTTDDTWSKPQFNAVRGLETVAMAGGVLLLLFLLVYRVGYGKWTNMGELNLAAFFTAILCWLTILAGLIVFCAYYWPVVGTSPLVTTNSFPWSLVMCLFAAFFFIVVCVLIRVKCRDRSRLKNAIPISGDTRMETYPVTKHGLLHRYFLPLYRGLRGNNREIGYQSEAKNIRLVDAEEHTQVTAIDNAAFYENRVLEGNNVNYRHLPIENGHAGTPRHPQQAETVIRRSLPTAIVTYTDGQANDLHRLHAHGGATDTAAAQQHTGQQGQRAGGRDALLLRHADDGAPDIIYREGGADTRGGPGYQSGGGVSPRDGIYREGGADTRGGPGYQSGGGVSPRDGIYREGGADTRGGPGYLSGGGVSPRDGIYREGGVDTRGGPGYQSGGGVSPRDGIYREGGTDTRGGTGYQSGGGVSPRDDIYREGGADTRGGTGYQSGGGVSPRDGIYREGGADTRGGGGTTGYQSGGASPRDGFDHGGVTSRDAAYRAGAVTSDVTYQTATGADGEGTYLQATGDKARGSTTLQGGHLESTGEGAAGLRDLRYQNGTAGMREGMRDHLTSHHTEGDASRTAAGGGGAAYLTDAHSRDAATAYQRSGDAVTTRDGAFGHGGVRRDAFGNIITEERVITTTTTTTYVTEEGRLKRGGLKVTEIESNDGSLQHFSATRRTRSDGDDDASVKPYDDTYIYRPFAKKEA